MKDYSDYILKLLHKDSFIDQWKSQKYKEKPIILYGNSGIGKTTLANYILQDFIKIEINIDFCKNCKSLDHFIDMSVNKESITMMFEKKKKKCILFDDLKYIQENDKHLFKQIINFSKKKKDYPIIYIFNTISHKLAQIIYKNSYPIHLEYTVNQITEILKKFYFQNEKNINYSELIYNSNNNFHNILVNKEFYQKNTNNIQKIDKIDDDLSKLLIDIYEMDSLEDKYRYSVNDYNILSLNILENCIQWIFKLKIPYGKKMNLINKIYSLNCINDIFYNKLHKNKVWNLFEHNITYSIIIPLYYLSQYNAVLNPIHYNKYISNSIIYTYNIKLLDEYGINCTILSCIYNLIQNKQFSKCLQLCNYYEISFKLCEKFHKYFLDSKKDIKIVFGDN